MADAMKPVVGEVFSYDEQCPTHWAFAKIENAMGPNKPKCPGNNALVDEAYQYIANAHGQTAQGVFPLIPIVLPAGIDVAFYP